MAADSIENLLGKVLKTKGIDAALVVSRSGMHVAGDPPGNVHLETFVAMSAIVLGAAETAAAELEQGLDSVDVRAGSANLVLTGLGKKGILVLSLSKGADGKAILLSLVKETAAMGALIG